MSNQIQEISLDQIDAPKLAMRSDIHDEGIEELAKSIRDIGLIQPIVLKPVGERYEIIAGHRRVVASKLAGLILISAIVRNPSDSDATVLKLHENLLRRDVNPVDEAVFLATIMKEEKYNLKQICEMTRRSESYISSRLEILDYPNYLIEAVGNKQVSLGAAHWLNKITDEKTRRNYTGYGMQGGISVKRAQAWFDSWDRGLNYSNPLEIKEEDEKTGEQKTVHKEQCILCGGYDVPDAMMLYYAHMECVEKLKQ